MDIKDNIKTICKARGRTFAQLANDLNITRQTLFRQLTGNTTTDTLKKIADCLNVPPFILLHPDPARAMEQDERPQATRPAPSYPAPVRLLCPCCNSPLLLSIQPAEEGRTSNNQDNNQDNNQQSNDGQTDDGQTNGPKEEGRPEQMELF